jgi:hypothetical protein
MVINSQRVRPNFGPPRSLKRQMQLMNSRLAALLAWKSICSVSDSLENRGLLYPK